VRVCVYVCVCVCVCVCELLFLASCFAAGGWISIRPRRGVRAAPSQSAPPPSKPTRALCCVFRHERDEAMSLCRGFRSSPPAARRRCGCEARSGRCGETWRLGGGLLVLERDVTELEEQKRNQDNASHPTLGTVYESLFVCVCVCVCERVFVDVCVCVCVCE